MSPYDTGSRYSRRRSFWSQFLPAGRAGRQRLITYVVTALFIFVLASVVGAGALVAWYSRDLPRPDRIRRTAGFSTIIYDRNGVPLYDIFGDENRVPIELKDIPKELQQATISIEDKDFYTHTGFSQKGLIRAFLTTLFFGRMEGGSTLTQQLVKNALLTNERTLPRKIKEFILANQIESKYSKDEILQMYLNETSYGGATAGVEKASQYYFGKSAKELSRIESIVLAGLPQSPSQYSPYGENPKAYVWRAEQVARRMREDGHITKQQEDEIKKQLPNVKFTARSNDMKAPHFVMYVRQQLIDKFGEQAVETGGLRVTTTLDWKLQEQAEKIAIEEIDKLKNLRVGNAAAVVIDPKTGAILTMLGSKDYFASEGGTFNVITQGIRQPGSSIKPIAYAAAMEKGYTPATLLFDTETHFPGGAENKDYIPKNYDGKYRGPMQLRYALANSLNVIAVKLQAMIGVKEMLTLAHDMGISTLAPTDEVANRVGLSVVLGGGDVKPLELMNAFGVFASGGEYREPYAIAKITDSKNKVLFEHKEQKGKRVLARDVAFLISSILSDNDARKEVFGTRSSLYIPNKTVAVKTGTTDDYRDNWTVGYTPSVLVGVWTGNNDNSQMNSRLVSGVTGSAPIWNRIMKEALKDKKDEQFEKPDTVIEMEIDAIGGGLPKDGVPKRKEFFIKGTEPTDTSSIYKKIKVSKSNPNKLANAVEIARGDYEEKHFIVFTETDPISTDGKNRWQEAIDAWAEKQTDSKYKPPKETSDDKINEIVVSIEEPEDRKKINENDFRVKAKASGSRDIKKMEIEIDGAVVKTVDDSRIDEPVTLSDGPHKIKVRAFDSDNRSGDKEIRIGVKVDWDAGVTPTP